MTGAMPLSDWIAGGGLLAIVVFSVGTYVRANNAGKEACKKIQDLADNSDKKFTHQDVCKKEHEAITQTLQEIKTKVNCIPEIKTCVDLLLMRKEKRDN